jgi:hypothetical protein
VFFMVPFRNDLVAFTSRFQLRIGEKMSRRDSFNIN